MQSASPHKHTIKDSNSFLWNDGRNVKCEYDSEIEDECANVCECVLKRKWKSLLGLKTFCVTYDCFVVFKRAYVFHWTFCAINWQQHRSKMRAKLNQRNHYMWYNLAIIHLCVQAQTEKTQRMKQMLLLCHGKENDAHPHIHRAMRENTLHFGFIFCNYLNDSSAKLG